MYKQKKQNRKFILTAVLFAVMLIGCKKDKTDDVSSPAYQINQSNHLTIPAAIELPADLPGGHLRVATYYAEGVQKYKAQAKAGSAGIFEWVFVAPQANLYNGSNKKIGTHGAGPFWELSSTDSIFAQHFTPSRTAPSPDGSIDWLLLMPKVGKTATGIFAEVAYIQRIATTGGKAPLTPPTSALETAEINYTAIYRFTKKN
jgi:hypothetical protein